MSRGRPLTKSELDLWRRFTADVQPLADTPPEDETSSSVAKAKPARTKPVQSTGRADKAGKAKPVAETTPKALDPGRPIDIDRRNWERLKRGRIDIERKLDLHGRTQAEAHDALSSFLTMASATGLRCVLVVTGKGGADGRGVLRQMVPRWLGEAGNRQKVLTYCTAQPRHGGDGALYVMLKRRREGRG